MNKKEYFNEARWHQDKTYQENRIYLEKHGILIYFVVPEWLELKNIHKDCLKLVEYLLFEPWDKDMLKYYLFTRSPKGKAIGLAYSGGCDSNAALTLLNDYPELKVFYIQRDNISDGVMTQENPINIMKQVSKIRNEEVYRIKTNMEAIIKLEQGSWVGFSTDLAVLVGAILTADYLGIKYLSCGMMLESTYLQKGYTYRDFATSDYWKKWQSVFKEAGFELLFPVVPCSEICTNKISDSGIFKNISVSCLRSKELGKGCDNCYKCFRKKLIKGELLPVNDDAKRYIKQDHIKQGASLIYAMNHGKFKIEGLEKYSDLDYSFLEGYYEKALEIIPKKMKPFIKEQLEKYVKPMNYKLEEFKWKE